LALIGFLVSLLGFLLVDSQSLLYIIPLSCLLYCYSALPFRFKSIPVLDFITGGMLYCLGIWLIGYVLAGGPALSWTSLPPNLIFLLTCTGVYHVMAAIFDQQPDTTQGIQTSAVAFGIPWCVTGSIIALIVASLLIPGHLTLHLGLFVYVLYCGLFFIRSIRHTALVQKIGGEYAIYLNAAILFFAIVFNPALLQ
jgi:4-hydroxybenzoate polyprenyltransferase